MVPCFLSNFFLLVESSTVPVRNMRKKDKNVTENVRSYISPRMAKWLVEAAGATEIQKGTKKETLGEDLAARFFF